MSDIFSHSQEAFRGQNQESLISSAFDYWCGVPWSPYSSRRGEGRGVDERQWWSQFKMRVACPYLACPTSSNVFQFQRPPAKRYVINHHHAACQIQDADISVHISHPLEYYVFEGASFPPYKSSLHTGVTIHVKEGRRVPHGFHQPESDTPCYRTTLYNHRSTTLFCAMLGNDFPESFVEDWPRRCAIFNGPTSHSSEVSGRTLPLDLEVTITLHK